MFGKLNDLFKGKKPVAAAAGTPAPPPTPRPAKLRRENLERRFSIIAETGQGSMSKVYRALDLKVGRTVCLKVQDSTKAGAAASRASQAGRPTEGEIGQQINHPHVVRTYEFGLSTKREYYVVMEFIDGLSLQFVRQSRPLSLPEKLELLAQCAEGLAEVHARGFIHHDIGPKNFLVDREDRVRLIDFGLAVPNTPAFRRPGNRTGTLNYMAPELLRRETIDERIDIFSYGATAFEFLTNRLPFDDTSKSMAAMTQRINQDALDPAEANPRLPAEVCDLMRKTLARRPADRWPTMATLPDALRDLAARAS